MEKQGLTAWLIIFLAVVIFGLAWLIGYNKHLQTVKDLNTKIENLEKQLEKKDFIKEEAVFSSPEAASSALPKQDLPSSPASEFEIFKATGSGGLE
jgi:hypothetical protein